jgi:nicotinic acid mononucleotide adenylyltransferase
MRSTATTTMKNNVRKICLFGTSANPPTNAHVGVVEALMKLKEFDEIHILPVYSHTFHSKRNQLIDYNHRVAMCEVAFQELIIMRTMNNQKQNDNDDDCDDCDASSATTTTTATTKTTATKVVVSRAEEDSFNRMCSSLSASSNNKDGVITEEERSNLRVGTADLLEMLIKQEQQQQEGNTEEEVLHAEFSFCLGADTFMDLTDWKWNRSKDVLKLLDGRLVVVNRKQHDNKQQQEGNNNHEQKQEELELELELELEQKKLMILLRQRIDYINTSLNGQVILLDVPTLGNISSSMARSMLSSKNGGDQIENLKNTLPLTVVDYIRKHKLYGAI